MNVLSLGAGVQSSTLLEMAVEGDLPRLDAIYFADTGNEPAAVYAHVEYLKTRAADAGFAFHTVRKGDIYADTLEKAAGAETRIAYLPLHIRNRNGSSAILRRQCSAEYKIEPIQRVIRASLKARGEKVCHLQLGISLDEVARMKPARVQYITHVFPLIDHDPPMRRSDCLHWLHARGRPIPPKSSCLVCPYHNNAYWHDLREQSPSEFAACVELDRRIRRLPRIDGEVFLHRSLKPLGEVDLTNERERGQMALFNDFSEECEGRCGL